MPLASVGWLQRQVREYAMKNSEQFFTQKLKKKREYNCRVCFSAFKAFLSSTSTSQQRSKGTGNQYISAVCKNEKRHLGSLWWT